MTPETEPKRREKTTQNTDKSYLDGVGGQEGLGPRTETF